MRSDYYSVDIKRLYEHIDNIRNEKRTALLLQDRVNWIKRTVTTTMPVDSVLTNKFQHLSQDIDDLARFYSGLADAVDDINFDAVTFLRTVENLLDEHMHYMQAHQPIHT